MLRFLLLSTVAVALVAFLLSPAHMPTPLVTKMPMEVGDRAPASTRAGAGYVYGRWREPIRDVSVGAPAGAGLGDRLWTYFSQKRWHYTSLMTDELFVGFAIVQLNYVADAFLYVVEHKDGGSEKLEYQGRMPLGFGTNFAPSSVDGCSEWSDPLSDDYFRCCYVDAETGWQVLINATLVSEDGQTRKPLSGSFTFAQEEALAFSFPVGDQAGARTAYVHKAAGAPARGALTLGSAPEHRFDAALASLDWTHSLPLRETTWNWGAASFVAEATAVRADGSRETKAVRVGINLSARVYDVAATGGSIENCLWVDGRLVVMDFPLAFSVPEDAGAGAWRVAGPGVDLTFTPRGLRQDHTNLGLVVSDFVQPYGDFSGLISVVDAADGTEWTIPVEGFGVVEDHHAVW